MKVIIDGQPIPLDDIVGFKTTSIDIQNNESQSTREKIVSQEFEISGIAFDIIEAQILNNPEGELASIPVKIFEDSCCDEDILLFEGIIRGDSVDWCHGECKARVQFFEQTTETLASDCVKSTLVADNWNGFQQQINHPRVVYCVEVRPDFIAFLMMLFALIVQLVFNLLTPVVAALSAVADIIGVIIDAVNSLGANINNPLDFDGNEETGLLEEYQNFQAQVFERLIACGRKHPSPFVRSYVNNVCLKCGLTFSSSILNNSTSDYFNLMYLYAPVKKGTNSDTVTYIPDNQPGKTLDMFLDEIKQVFNADWDITGTTLRFERRDFFWTGDPAVNYSTLQGQNRIKDKLCFNYRGDERPAFGKFDYIPDALDLCGNEALDRYNDVVEWNQPFNALQSKYKAVSIPFSPPRFRGDGVEPDFYAQWQGENGIGEVIASFENVLLLSAHLAGNPKLIIWDPQSGIINARGRRYAPPGYEIEVPPSENFNFPMQFNEWNAAPNTAYPTTLTNAGLYPRFWSIENPKTFPDQGREWQFSFYYNCESLQSILGARYAQLPTGLGRITKITINLADKSVDLTGEI